MKFVFFILVMLASIPAVWQILTPGYFPMHDNTQVVRVQQMHKALLSGQFPVRWVPDLGYGYGYPIFNFYNPLPYYVGAGFMFLGLDALVATKTMMAIGVILSGVSMFVLAASILKRSDLIRSDLFWLTALLAAMLYVYAPYHAVQIYVRGAVAETWAYAILPFVFWALLNRRVIAGALALAALILSHNLTAFMSIPFVALFFLSSLLFRTRPDPPVARSAVTPEPRTSALREREAGSLRTEVSLVWGWLLMIGLALGLSSFFWLPALVEAPKTRLSEMVFQEFDLPSKHLVTMGQLWNSPWGYGGSSAGLDDGMSFQVGKIQLIGSVAAIAILLYCYVAKRRSAIYQDSKITIFLVSGFLFSTLLMLPASLPIWDSFSILSYIQFPWRLFTFAALFASLLTAQGFYMLLHAFSDGPDFSKGKIAGTPEPRNRALRQHGRRPWAEVSVFLGLIVLIIYSYRFFHPQFKFPTTAAELTSRERIVWEVSKRSDEYLPIGFIRPKSLEEALHDGNAYNQQLVDELKKPTTARRVGTLISFLSVLFLIWKGLNLRTQGQTF